MNESRSNPKKRRFTVFPQGRFARLRLSLLGVAVAALFTGGGLVVYMPGRSHAGPLPSLTEDERDLAARLDGHVRALCGFGPRNFQGRERLDATVAYLTSAFSALGDQVVVEEYEVVRDRTRARNLSITRPGPKNAEIVIVGAHYDSVSGCPGADDNASGTAGLLEIARILKGRELGCELRFVAFANEEPPYFQTPLMGSLVHARASKARGEVIRAMISLETIGYYSDSPGSQQYPRPFSLFYPSVGDFIAFVGNTSSRSLVTRSIASFRSHTAFPSEGIAAPGHIPGVGWSDHWSFWQIDAPALMITDTAPFRYRWYHTNQDSPEKLDYERMARVTAGVARVVAELAR